MLACHASCRSVADLGVEVLVLLFIDETALREAAQHALLFTRCSLWALIFRFGSQRVA